MTTREDVGQVGYRKKQKIYRDGRRFSRSLMPLGPDPSDYPRDRYELINPDGSPYRG